MVNYIKRIINDGANLAKDTPITVEQYRNFLETYDHLIYNDFIELPLGSLLHTLDWTTIGYAVLETTKARISDQILFNCLSELPKVFEFYSQKLMKPIEGYVNKKIWDMHLRRIESQVDAFREIDDITAEIEGENTKLYGHLID